MDTEIEKYKFGTLIYRTFQNDTFIYLQKRGCSYYCITLKDKKNQVTRDSNFK